MLLDFYSALWGVELVLDALVAVAQIYQEDVVSAENFEAALGDHWNLTRRVDCQVRIFLVITIELVDLLKLVLHSSNVDDGEDGSSIRVEVVTPDGELASLWSKVIAIFASSTAHFYIVDVYLYYLITFKIYLYLSVDAY